MARKAALRDLRTGTVINAISSRQEKALGRAMTRIAASLAEKFPAITLGHESQWLLKDVVAKLRAHFPDIDFDYRFASSAMRPDGGILSLLGKDRVAYPILIAEKKNQGTNDLRALEGKTKQAKGNAIERLGKNVIGFRTAFKMETIFPFVCFGDGCDFAVDSSILDRVVTIAMFGRLNVENVQKLGGGGEFDRGSFFFRPAEWTEEEMFTIGLSIATKSVFHYFSRYGEDKFATR